MAQISMHFITDTENTGCLETASHHQKTAHHNTILSKRERKRDKYLGCILAAATLMERKERKEGTETMILAAR